MFDHTTPELEAWMEAHHDPKFKPKKYRPRKTSLRALTPRQRERVESAWRAEVSYQVAKYGPPNHLPLDSRIRAVGKLLAKNSQKVMAEKNT